MKRVAFRALCVGLLLCVGMAVQAQIRPYVIGARTSAGVDALRPKVKEALQANGIEVVGEYRPVEDPNRWLIAITSPELKQAVRSTGGLRGFALALRVALTREGNETVISYTNPEYWGRAYFQKDYGKVAALYDRLSGKLARALNPLGRGGGQTFGSEDGLSASDLEHYHYMFGMPYFEDNVELARFGSYDEAVRHIDQKLARGVPNVVRVYSVALPDKQLKLYGIGLRGPDGEGYFMPKIDFNTPRHTAFLPYEMLVYGNKVYMLHGRFRIALSFPDLSMGTFMKIVSTPGAIESMLQSITR